MAQSHSFKRLRRDIEKISPLIRMKRIKLGFWRIYFKQAWIHEVFEEMPQVGYNFEAQDERLDNQQYFEELEDNAETIRRVKNYVEGYWDSLRRIQVRAYLLRHDREAYENAEAAYRQVTIK